MQYYAICKRPFGYLTVGGGWSVGGDGARLFHSQREATKMARSLEASVVRVREITFTPPIMSFEEKTVANST